MPGHYARLQWGRDLPTAEIQHSPPTLFAQITFNGAAIFRPRKCWIDPRLNLGLCSFNGAAIFRPRKCVGWGRISVKSSCLQWGRDLPTAEMRNQDGTGTLLIPFNGAAIFRPRKYPVSPTPPCQGDPSMGPRSSDRGNANPSCPLARLRGAFNGAAIFRPRKISCNRVHRGRGPSMGPRSSDRGNSELDFVWSMRLPSFNGAAIFRPRKSLPLMCNRSPKCPFNGAAIFRPRKSPPNRIDNRLSRPSMGPRSSDRGNRGYPTVHDLGLNPFNGAAIFRPRKCGIPRSLNEPSGLPSMGPRSSDRGNPLPLPKGRDFRGRTYHFLQWGRDLPTAEIARLPNIRIVKELSAPREQ